MKDVTSEQLNQYVNYIQTLENALKTIRREAKAIDDQLIVDIVDSALNYEKENLIESRIDYLNSELRRVDNELTKLYQFTLSNDPTLKKLLAYKKHLFSEIEKLVS